MKPASNSIIIFDVDGVLLDMAESMRQYISLHTGREHSYKDLDSHMADFSKNPGRFEDLRIRFSHSDFFRNMPAICDMFPLVKEMKGIGFDLAIVTAAMNDQTTIQNRLYNLHRTYPNLFHENHVHFTNNGDKQHLIEAYARQYDHVIFCDDSPKAVIASASVVTLPVYARSGYYKHDEKSIDLTSVKIAHCAAGLRQHIVAYMRYFSR